MATLTLQQRLDAAEDAYHALQTGAQARVFQDQNGERVEYTAANSSKLAAYVADLKRQIDSSTEIGPMRIFF